MLQGSLRRFARWYDQMHLEVISFSWSRDAENIFQESGEQMEIACEEGTHEEDHVQNSSSEQSDLTHSHCLNSH